MPVKKNMRELGRRKLRYRLYRIKTGTPVDSSDGLKSHFESQDEFDGWHNFGITWDTGSEGVWPEGHFVAIPLKESLEQMWQKTVLGLTREFPGTESEDE